MCLVGCKVGNTQHVVVYQDGKRLTTPEPLKEPDYLTQVVAVGGKCCEPAKGETKSELDAAVSYDTVFNGPLAGFSLWHRPLTLEEIGSLLLAQMPAKPWKPHFWKLLESEKKDETIFSWLVSSKNMSICPLSRLWVDLKHGDLVEVKSPAARQKKEGVLVKTDGTTCSVRFNCTLEIKEATYGYGNNPAYRVPFSPFLARPAFLHIATHSTLPL